MVRLEPPTCDAGRPVTWSAQIALVALIIGKAVLLADLWPPIDRFPEKPLIYNIVWKTVTHHVVASVIHYLERLDGFAKEATRRQVRPGAVHGVVT